MKNCIIEIKVASAAFFITYFPVTSGIFILTPPPRRITFGPIMPHTTTWWGLMLEMYRQHKTTADIFMLVTLGVIVRVFYWGGKLRECCGDVLIGVTIMMFAAARLPSFDITIPEFGSLHFSHYEIAFVIGLLGYKGLKAVVFWVLKARFGIDLRERIAQRKSTSN